LILECLDVIFFFLNDKSIKFGISRFYIFITLKMLLFLEFLWGDDKNLFGAEIK
jgi:hypothetical protein